MTTNSNIVSLQGKVPRQKPTPPSEQFRIADWNVDPAANRLSRGNQTTRLEPKVMEVLVYLAAHCGKVVTREELEAEVWAGSIVGYDTLTGAIQKLRRAFDDDPKDPQVIETLSKKGYRLVASVESVSEPLKALQTNRDSATIAQILNRLSRTGKVASFIILLAITATAGALFWLSPWKATGDIAGGETKTSSIAVLPFNNLSGDPEQEYFADGITDDLITGLARNPALLVIARDSTFVYKDQPLDVREIAERLAVRYILNGSVRRVDERVRINAQLVDTTTEGHLWAERYDGELSNIFELQDEITQKIMSALAVRISSEEQQDFGMPLTDNPLAYDSFLNGRQRFYLYLNKDENRKARELFQKAIEFDPDFVMAYAMLAWTHAFDVMNGWSDRRDHSLLRAQELATKAISLQQALPVAYFVRGLAYREMEEYIKALVEAEKAIEYDPNYANAYVLLATLLYYAGRPEESLERIKKAMRLNPHHPYNYTFHLGQAYYILERYDKAIEAFNNGIASNPASERLHLWLAAAHAQSGDIDEAEWEADQVLTLNPDFSLRRMQQAFPFKDPADREHFLVGLRKAGLTE